MVLFLTDIEIEYIDIEYIEKSFSNKKGRYIQIHVILFKNLNKIEESKVKGLMNSSYLTNGCQIG